MKKLANTAVELHPILAERWSPRSFDATHEISDSDVLGILEAARWSPSSNNSQPWRFIVAKRGSDEFKKILKTLLFQKMNLKNLLIKKFQNAERIVP